MKTANNLIRLIPFIIILLLSITACTYSVSSPTPGSPAVSTAQSTVTVGSKIDTEGGLLAQIIILILNQNGIPTVDKSQLGPTQIVRQALLNGQIDLYPEYTGNGAVFFPDIDPGVWHDAQKGYEQVKTLDQQRNHIIWLQSAPANNTWAIAIPQSLAAKENLKSLHDLADYINQGGDFKLAASDEFVTSSVALPAFEKAYGFTLSQNQLLTFSGGNTAQTEKAAADGTSGVNAAMAYGTDGSLAGLKLVILSDPLGVQPVYAPAPIVREVVYSRFPQMANILKPVFQSLDLTTLQTLNGNIALNGQSPADVARNYLKSRSFLK